jgi:Mg2+ and Co2+ transporter CorA
LAIVWHALYAWDEALETLYTHVCWLESQVIKSNDVLMTQELHIIRAHLLHWESLLEDLAKVITFLLKTPNPSLEHTPEPEREHSIALMKKECGNLDSEIHRLEKSRNMMDRRLKNVMNLVFSTVNIEDSSQMKKLTQAAVLDSAAMKQVAYLTMIFLPATFVAGVFGMNVSEINPGSLGTLPHYVETALPLTLLTIYLIITFQSKNYMGNQNASVWMRLWWPVTFAQRTLGLGRKRATDTATGFNDLRTATMDARDARNAKAIHRALIAEQGRHAREMDMA